MKKENVKIIYKKKKSTGKTVTIVFLFLLVLGLSSYIGYEKYQEQTMEKEIEEDEELEEELYYSEVLQLLEKIEDYNQIFSRYYPIYDFKKVDNQTKLNYGIYMLQKYENTNNYYEKSDMKQVYKKNFTSSMDVVYEDITCSNKDGVLYHLENGIYTIDRNHVHELASININTIYVESKKMDTVYQITVHLLYSDYCIDTCPHVDAYYSSYQDAVDSTNKVLDSLKDYDTFKKNLKRTTFTFEKEGDNYLLKRVSN